MLFSFNCVFLYKIQCPDPTCQGKGSLTDKDGEDMGDEFNEVVDRLEKGESPESIEQSMPDLGANDSPMSDF